MLDRTELIPVADGERRRIGPIDCQFVPVTHSVPHGFAIAFFTPAGTIMHTGDFKLDLTPVDGRRTDLALLGELARRDGGVRLLLSDSTNAERPGFTPSESTVGPVDARRCSASTPTSASSSRASRRTCTASQQVAAGRDRRTAARSRSSAGRWTQNVTMARERGFVDIAPYARARHRGDRALRARRHLHHLHRIAGRADERAVADGRARAQAREGLARRHRRDQRRTRSPGNESNVSRVIDSLHRAGAEVVHDRTSPVHVSGHASPGRAEVHAQPGVARVVRPGARRVPPPRAPRPARRRGRRARDHVLVCEDGDVVTLGPEGAEVERRAVPAGYMYVDGIVGDISHGVLRDRRMLVGGGRRRRDRHRRLGDRRDRHRSRDRDARLGARARGRGPASRTPSRSCATSIADAAQEGATDFDTHAPPRRASRSAASSTSGRAGGRP